MEKFNHSIKIPPVIFQILALAGLLLWLYGRILTKLAQDWWTDPNYLHGFLIPVISLYLVWERRNLLCLAEIVPSRWGLWVISLGLSLLYAAHIGAELFLMRISLLVVLMGLVLYLGGPVYARVLTFPIGFLTLMIPLPAIVLNAISSPLQRFAAKSATLCLQSLSLPVFRDGNIIVLPHLTLEVSEACSGLRSLVSLLALGIIFAYFSQSLAWKRLILIISTIPIAIMANALRVTGTGILAHYAGEEMAQGFYHTFSGWLVFVVAFLALTLEGAFLSGWDRIRNNRRG